MKPVSPPARVVDLGGGVGWAGAGKTFALDAARGAWEAAGHQMLGCSLSARAARQLESSAGIPDGHVERMLLRLSQAGRLSTRYDG